MALAVVGTQHLVVVGATKDDPAHGAIATSDDGGLTWDVRALATPPLNGVAAYGKTVLLTADCPSPTGPDCVWKSLDSGATFSSLNAVPRLDRPGLVDERRGIVMTPMAPLTDLTTLWKTNDSGATWTQTSTHCDQWAPSTVAIDYASTDASWTACAGPISGGQEAREIWKSNWNGSTLLLMAGTRGSETTGILPTEGRLMGISLTADGYGWLWTNDQLYFTSDEGRTWVLLGSQSIVAAHVVNHNAGFAILSNGSSKWVAATMDGGSSWSPRPVS
jgi:photosystem II stability/assembly factor-like uncharacterized protein